MLRSRLIKYSIVFVVCILALGTFLLIKNIPPVEEQIPDSPVSAQIVTPLNGEVFDSLMPVQFQVQATSPNNVVSVEFWVDGQLLETQPVSQNFPQAVKVKTQWMTGASGIHVLMTKAMDAQGLTSQSGVVMVTVKNNDQITEYTASEGDTLGTIADFLGMSEEEVAAENPGLESGTPLSDGQVIQLPPPAKNPPNPPQDTAPLLGEPLQEPTAPPNPIIYKIKEIIKLGGTPESIPLSPKIWATVESCNQVHLTIVPQSDDEDGFIVYRWVFDLQKDLSFTKIAVLGPVGAAQQPVEFTDTLNGLAAYYYVSAFNTLGEASSTPVGVKYDLGCLGEQNDQPFVQIELNSDFVTSEPVDNSYCYYSTVPGEWQRFPSEEFEFITPGNDNFGLNLMIVDPPPVVVMECWGFGGGTGGGGGGVLMYLGKAETQLRAEPVTLVGEGFSLNLPPLPMLNGPTSQPGSAQMGGALQDLANKKVPAPINLREAESDVVCSNHLGIYAGDCQKILDKPYKEEYLLVWDWVEGSCWVGDSNCPWLSAGNTNPKFNLYMVGNSSPVASTTNLGMITPLPWGDQCFYVTAMFDTVIGEIESAPSNTYCPGQVNPPMVMVLKPTNIITQRKQSLYICPIPPADPAKGLAADQMMVGVYDTACWDQRFQGLVKFDLNQFYNLVGGYSLQKATLRFDQGSTTYQSYSPGAEIASNLKPACGLNVAWALGTGQWTSWNPATALQGGYSLWGYYENPITAFPVLGSSHMEVSVEDFVDNYQGNDFNPGFVIFSDMDALYGSGVFHWVTNNVCVNTLTNFELEIQYYPLGQ